MNQLMKLLGVALSLGAGIVGAKLVDFIWHKTTGKASPKDEDGLENSLRSAIAFALISGAVRAVLQVLTNRTAQRAANRFAKTRDLT